VATLIAFVVAMVLSAALWVFLHATDLGKSALAVLAGRDRPTGIARDDCSCRKREDCRRHARAAVTPSG
jgi:hypothetical protein